jgi:triacylglycerol lipase
MSYMHRFCSKARGLAGTLANAAALILALGVSLLAPRPAAAQQTPQSLFQQTCFSAANTPTAPSGDPANPAALTTYPYSASYAGTQYPIILLTGGFGSPNGGENNSQYFYDIPQTLAYYGATACVPDLSGVDTDGGTNGRGAELITYLEQLRIYFDNPNLKFNLIGHSQGGWTARVVEDTRPDLVASVTTIGTPHQGSPLGILFEPADLIPAPLAPVLEQYINDIAGATGILNALNPGANPNLIGLLQEGSPTGTALFNQQYPSAGLGNYAACTTGAPTDTPTYQGSTFTIPLFSWAGAAEHNVNPLGPYAPPVVGDASISGPSDPALSEDYTTGATEVSGQVIMSIEYLLGPLFGYPAPVPANDGAVDVCSAKLGTFLGTYPFNHLNEVNREEAEMGANAIAADPVNLFLVHAHRLQGLGL